MMVLEYFIVQKVRKCLENDGNTSKGNGSHLEGAPQWPSLRQFEQ